MIMSEENGTSAGTVLLSFLAGAAVGAGFALLYAPKSGEELRGQIRDLTNDAVDKIKDYASEAQDRIKAAVDDGKEYCAEKKTIISSAIEAGKEAMEKEKERLRDA